jgi:hypothetical protein
MRSGTPCRPQATVAAAITRNRKTMKRLTLSSIAVAAAFALSASAADAQTIGFKLGASMSNLSIDGTTGDTDWNTGFVGGGFVRFGFGRIGIQPEILSVTKGAEFDGEGDDDGSIKIEYIAIPVLLHLPLTYGSSFAPYIIAGPEFAFDIGCEISGPGGDLDCDDDSVPDGPLSRKSIDVGLSAGGGLAFAMGPGALLLEGRYTWGMTNIDDSQDAVELKNRSAYFTAGYSIPIGRRY